VISYRKFSDSWKGEVYAPTQPKAPKAPKVDLTGSKAAPTLDALGSLGGHAPSGEFCNTPAGAWTDSCKEPGAINDHSGGAVAEWAAALAQLDPNKPPGDVPPLRWGRFIDDARKFLASDWPRQAADLACPLRTLQCTSSSSGGFRTPAAGACPTAVSGRHPKPFT
jgi:hypothetical protein